MALAERIRVFVLHDDPIARAGLSTAFAQSPDIDVHTSQNSRCGVSRAPARGECDASVVVADYANAVRLAADTIRRASGASFPPILVVGGSDREWEIRHAVACGIRGYLMAGCSLEEVFAGIRAVHRGARYLCAQVAARLAESISVERLTLREEDVLRLLVEGHCNKAIGRQLGITVGTVKSHLKSIFAKLDVGSRTQAVAAVERRGLLANH